MSRHIEDAAAAAHPVVTTVGRDYLAWAKRIIYRDEHKDKTLLPIQVQFARQALGMVDKPREGA